MKLLRHIGLVSRVACCVLGVAAHRALKRPRYTPDRMCGFDCHVYYFSDSCVLVMGPDQEPRDAKRVTGA
eukprot:3689341-Prymnesium_polylepis.1